MRHAGNVKSAKMLLAGAGGGQRRSVGGMVATRSARPEDEEGKQCGGAGAGRLPQPALPECLCQRAGQAAAQAHDRPAAEDPPPPVPPDQGVCCATRLRVRSSDAYRLATMSESEGGVLHSVASGNAILRVWRPVGRSACNAAGRADGVVAQRSLGDITAPSHSWRPGQGIHCMGQSCAGSVLASRRQPGLHKPV